MADRPAGSTPHDGIEGGRDASTLLTPDGPAIPTPELSGTAPDDVRPDEDAPEDAAQPEPPD